MMKLVTFSPFSNIWEHSYPESLLTSGLASLGWEIEAITCDGVLNNFCVAMSAAGLSENAELKDRTKVCSACHKRRNLIKTSFGQSQINLETILTPASKPIIIEILASIDKHNWVELKVDGIPLGRYAAYEMWLHNKLLVTEFSDELWPIYLGQLENTLNTYFAAKNYFETNKVDAALVYNDRYSVNHAFCAAAELYGVNAYMIHGGWHMVRRGESLTLMKSGTTMADIFESDSWINYSKTPIDVKTIELVEEHFTGLWQGSSAFAYSKGLEGISPSTLRERLGIDNSSKVALASMSSLDEILGVQLIGMAPELDPANTLFVDQLEWVKHLLGFARKQPEIHVVLRLHPRMFPNKRELKLSPVVEEIMKLKDNAPTNFTFNVPEDEIGLYDLAQIVDVLLNYSSSVGAELMALGIPTVTPKSSYFYTYPNELNRIGQTKNEYDHKIISAVEEGWSIENSRAAFRWYGFLFTRVAAGFSETVTARPTQLRPKKPGFKLWLWKKLTFLILQYGPLVRERLSLRRKTLPVSTVEHFDYILRNKKTYLCESTMFSNEKVSTNTETKELNILFAKLLEGPWKEITDENSLAGRVRAHLS